MNIKAIQEKLIKSGYSGIKVEEYNGGVRLTGQLDSYDSIVECGTLAVDKKHSRGVINDVTLKGYEVKPMRMPSLSDDFLQGRTPDVLIIGGGIVGCAIARELSRYSLDVILAEKEYDVATHQSSRNDGMIHCGIDISSSSKKVKLNMRGNALYSQLSAPLDIPIRKVGQYVFFTTRFQKLLMPAIKFKGSLNNISVRYAGNKELATVVNTAGYKHGACYFSDAGMVCPYNAAIAFAESAVINGVTVSLNTAVTDIVREGNKIVKVVTNRGTLQPKVVINAAGVYSDVIAQMAGDRFFTIHPRKGTIAILDKKAKALSSAAIGRFATKTTTGKSHSKGGGIIRTIDDNILVGPNAIETPDREDESTTREDIAQVFDKQVQINPSLNKGDIITYFAGVRAPTYEEDFIVELSPVVPNFIQAAGIQSPGITAAPAIAQDVAAMVGKALGTLTPRANYVEKRVGIPVVRELSEEARNALIKKNPAYGVVVCRCEQITKGEIIDAIHRPIPALTIDAIKRRVRAGMGRCQGGFCSPIITKIIAEETGADLLSVAKKGDDSNVLLRYTKEAVSE